MPCPSPRAALLPCAKPGPWALSGHTRQTGSFATWRRARHAVPLHMSLRAAIVPVPGNQSCIGRPRMKPSPAIAALPKLLLFLVWIWVVLANAAPVSAHAFLESSDPAANAVLPTAPPSGHAALHRAAGDVVLTGRALRSDGSAGSWRRPAPSAPTPTIDDRSTLPARAGQRHLLAALAHALDRRRAYRAGVLALYHRHRRPTCASWLHLRSQTHVPAAAGVGAAASRAGWHCSGWRRSPPSGRSGSSSCVRPSRPPGNWDRR